MMKFRQILSKAATSRHRTCSKSSGRSLSWRQIHSDPPPLASFGIAFDIDGVILRGDTPIGGSPQAPSGETTNMGKGHVSGLLIGGGVPESKRATELMGTCSAYTGYSKTFTFPEASAEVLCDILSTGGLPGKERSSQPPLYFANDDLSYQGMFPTERLGMGAFRIALESIYNRDNPSVDIRGAKELVDTEAVDYILRRESF